MRVRVRVRLRVRVRVRVRPYLALRDGPSAISPISPSISLYLPVSPYTSPSATGPVAASMSAPMAPALVRVAVSAATLGTSRALAGRTCLGLGLGYGLGLGLG